MRHSSVVSATIFFGIATSGCSTPTASNMGVPECADVRRSVESAYAIFPKYRAGPFRDLGDGDRKWKVEPPLPTWQSCTLNANDLEESGHLDCKTVYPPGHIAEALARYPALVKAFSSCIIDGSVSNSVDRDSEGSFRTTTFDLVQRANDPFRVSIEIQLIQNSRALGGGYDINLKYSIMKFPIALKQ